MALGVRESKKFITVFHDKLELRAREGEKGAIQRTNKNDQIVNVHQYDFIEGRVKDLQWRDTDYGIQLEVMLEDGGDTYALQLSQGRQTQYFLMCCKNIDFKHKVKFEPGIDSNGNAMVWVKQFDSPVKYYYKKADMKDCPPPVQVKKLNKLKWDFSDQEEFLYEMIENDIAPAVRELYDANAEVVKNDVNVSIDEDHDYSDDIPEEHKEDKTMSLKERIAAKKQAEEEDDLPF